MMRSLIMKGLIQAIIDSRHASGADICTRIQKPSNPRLKVSQLGHLQPLVFGLQVTAISFCRRHQIHKFLELLPLLLLAPGFNGRANAGSSVVL